MLNMYKIVNEISSSYLNNMVTMADTKYEMRNHQRLKLSKYNAIKYSKCSIRDYGAKYWNALNNDTNSNKSFNKPKHLINEWSPMCNCQNCILCKMNALSF